MKCLICCMKLQYLLAVSLLLFAAGCGSGTDKWKEGREKVYPVSGKVTLNGEPLEDAVVMFHSASKELTAHAKTDADGFYQLRTYEDGDGAVVGEHTVAIRKVEYETVPSRNSTEDEPATQSIGKELLPKNFALPNTSPLKATVTEEGPNDDHNFEF